MSEINGETWLPLSQRARSNLKILATAVPAGTAVGTVYDLFQGWPVAAAISGGGVAGAVIAGLLVSAQLSRLPAVARRRLRRWPAIVYVTVIYMGALAAVLGAFAISSLTGPLAASRPVPLTYVFEPAGIVFALAVAAVFVAATALDRIVGPDVLLGIFTGRYLTPVQEYRVFLFADLVGSTSLAERIGDLAFHRYLDDLISLLDECVRQNNGRIYRYVGDEVIVTWPIDRDTGRRAVQALACVDDCRRVLRDQAPWFERQYGCRPEMRFALHAGPVVAGMMGGTGREIVFLGDTINTGAHLEDVAKATESGIVASQPLVGALPSCDRLRTRTLSRIQVRGKRNPLPVYELLDPTVGTAD